MGSGSTWTQHLVNSAVCPGYQCNSKVQPEGFNKRYMDLLALRKCHHMIELCDHPGIEKIILLVRNPLDALVANFNHKRVGRRSEVTDWSTDSRLWQKFLDGDKLDQWKNIYASHLTQNTTCTPKPHTKTYLLRYENLKNDLSGELRRLYEFLDVNISDNRFQEIMNDSEGCFHRKTSSKSVEKKSQNYSMNRFSPDKIKKLQRDEKLVNDLLKKYKVENYDG
ncbi:WSC domain-containing protein 1 [Lingula anatina]|uniref:WSC domain-containing protein 1 n=1 Tax=Lingula anatina TaxID=7574 RepID=A0A1S3JZY6_LINAN|nr:WSC domain-containing protein 1 [Lingula anatina]|eukprot:XP_013415664.1 WSC domain-containing protein 1 [Lingula anatina]